MAIVSINEESNLVRVEWFEKGETKGKDLEFRLVSLLNPTLKFKEELLPDLAESCTQDSTNVSRKVKLICRKTNSGRKQTTPVLNELQTEIIPKQTTSKTC